ncbi:MAG: family 20 glycosylhydrolase [Pseudomonadota bacterium]
MQLYPPPQQLRQSKAYSARGLRHYLKLSMPASAPLSSTLGRFAARHGLRLTFGSASPEAILLTLTRDTSLASEHYRLQGKPDGLLLEAGDDRGFYYGLATLSQILDQHPAAIPRFTIKDGPDFAHRGVMLDISRCKVPTLPTLFELIERLAALKYNQLQLYTEHTYAFANHPLVWADASPLTANDILALRDHCRAHFIELVPNLNSFGHWERWLRYPEYHEYAECPDGFTHPLSGQFMPFGSTLKPTRKSLRLVTELYDEYLPLFDSGMFNIGGDEPWELGLGATRKRCEQLGTSRVYVDFLSQIKKIVDRRDRTMMFWSDIVLKEPDALALLDRDMIAMNWGYEGNHPFRRECQQVAAAGLPFYVCPGTSSWNSLTGRTANAAQNLDNAARSGLAAGATGYLVTDWGDHGHHQYLPISYTGFVLGACHAWNHRGSRRLAAADGINRMFFGQAAAGVGDILVDLGRVLELAPSPIRNATIFNRLLFWNMQHESAATRDIPAASLEACLGALSDVAGRLPGMADPLVRSEVQNAIALAQHGIHRLQYFRGLRSDVQGMRRDLAEAIGQHQDLWLARNRPGGLRESVAHLDRAKAALD